VDSISTVDRGQYLSLSKWAKYAKEWILVLGAEELRSVDQLEKYIDLRELREVSEVAEYYWTIDGAIWQVRHGLVGSRTDSALAYLKDKIENGSATDVNDIASKLFDAVAALSRKGELS
jgi:hypothetical protein